MCATPELRALDWAAQPAWGRATPAERASVLLALARAMAQTLHGKQNRIQFTPDLLPADLTGARLLDAGCGTGRVATELTRLGHDVVIYDRMRENKPVGAALSLWSNGVKVLNWLGVGAEVAALGGDMADMVYLDGHTGETMCDFSLAPVTAMSGQKPYPVARADLQALMMDAVGTGRIHLGMQLVEVADDGTTVRKRSMVRSSSPRVRPITGTCGGSCGR